MLNHRNTTGRVAALVGAILLTGVVVDAACIAPAAARPRDAREYPICTRTRVDDCRQMRHSPRPTGAHEKALVERANQQQQR